MIAADTSSLVAYFADDAGRDLESLSAAFSAEQLVIPPLVLSELLSAPNLTTKLSRLFQAIPRIAIQKNYWERVGHLRRKLLSLDVKARMADTMIAQSCLDHDVPLITRDQDFRHFEQYAGLRLF
jgi:predicted nucleic acid-binding protein